MFAAAQRRHLCANAEFIGGAQEDAHLTARSSAARSGSLPRSSSGHQWDASWSAAPCLRAASSARLPRPLPNAPSASSWPHLKRHMHAE